MTGQTPAAGAASRGRASGPASRGTVVLGAMIPKEKTTPARLLSFASIIGGAIQLRVTAV